MISPDHAIPLMSTAEYIQAFPRLQQNMNSPNSHPYANMPC